MTKSAAKSRVAARQDRAASVQASIAAVVDCPLCPEITADVGLEILAKVLGPEAHPWVWWRSSKMVQESAARLTGDPVWRERALGWLDAFRDAHGHGPSWRQFWGQPSLWPSDVTRSVLYAVMRQLSQAGVLDGKKTPFGLGRRVPQVVASR